MFKQKLPFTNNTLFKYFASIKFAIPTLLAFAAAMAYGTIAESLYGTEYVRRGVYHTWWFYLIQGCIGISVIFAVLDRIPFKKRLVGFYTVHLAIITLFVGALITRYYGIDGILELHPRTPSSSVKLNDDVLYLYDGKIQHVIPLPEPVKPTHLTNTLALPEGTHLRLKTLVPYAKGLQKWVEKQGAWVSEWQLKNANVTQHFELSDGSLNYPSHLNMGPLSIEVLSPALFEAFSKSLNKKNIPFIVFDKHTNTYQLLRSLKHPHTFHVQGETFTMSKHENKELGIVAYNLQTPAGVHTFFPRFSTVPITEDLSPDIDAPYRFFQVALVQSQNSLFISRTPKGGIQLAFGKDAEWTFTHYKDKPIQLPWMGLELSLKSERHNQMPITHYEATKPHKEAERNTKAVLVEVTQNDSTETFWVDDKQMTQHTAGTLSLQGFIGSKTLRLPFEMALEKFKMDTNPGTMDAASYESFVKVRYLEASDHQPEDGSQKTEDEKTVHIYMNHPYKAAGYTFYQSSYRQDEKGEFHSFLSVNKDPGRPVKYTGAGLLVLGLILHFLVIYGYIPLGERKEAIGDRLETK